VINIRNGYETWTTFVLEMKLINPTAEIINDAPFQTAGTLPLTSLSVPVFSIMVLAPAEGPFLARLGFHHGLDGTALEPVSFQSFDYGFIHIFKKRICYCIGRRASSFD
jgi:hypothetical protein